MEKLDALWSKLRIAPSIELGLDQPFFDMTSLAAFLRTDIGVLHKYQNCPSMAECYKTFYINKDTNKIVPWSASLRLREINAPTPQLKALQARLLELFNMFPKHECNFAFMEGKNIKLAADTTTEGDVMVHVDLKDFFESHTALYIKRKFKELFHARFGSNLDDATLNMVVTLCTRNQVLPQGSVCSPMLTIILNHELDTRLQQLSIKYGLTYTRYADDMYFTGNATDEQVSLFVSELSDAVHPFRINYKKLNIMRNRAYPLLRGIAVRHTKHILPSTQSAKIAMIMKGVLNAPGARTLVTKNEVTIITPKASSITKDECSAIIEEIKETLARRYPDLEIKVKPKYFYIQSLKKCLGLHVLPGEVKFPRKKYNSLRLEAMLMGIQRALLKVFKDQSMEFAGMAASTRKTAALIFAGLSPNGIALSRNLLTHPHSRKVFNGNVAFLQSIDPIKADKIRAIEDKAYKKCIANMTRWSTSLGGAS